MSAAWQKDTQFDCGGHALRIGTTYFYVLLYVEIRIDKTGALDMINGHGMVMPVVC